MSKLITNNGIAVKQIAGMFLSMKIGDKIPRVEDFAKDIGVGRGTVQNALAFLKENGGVALKATGHTGTFITDIHKKKLFNIAGFSSIFGTMPLPYSKRYEGLATALYTEFESADIEFNLAYQRGSDARISGVLAGRYDFAVCSHLAAVEAMKRDEGLEIAMGFGSGSYVGGHAIILRDGFSGEPFDGIRVAVDPNSIDQMFMTQQWLKDAQAEFIKCPYNQLIKKLDLGEVDVAVWNGDEAQERFSQLKCIELNLPSDMLKMDTEAVIVCLKEKLHQHYILNEVIDVGRVVEIQRQIIEDKMLPKY